MRTRLSMISTLLVLGVLGCGSGDNTSLVFDLTVEPGVSYVEAWGVDQSARPAFPASSLRVPKGTDRGTIVILLSDDTPERLLVGLRGRDEAMAHRAEWSDDVTIAFGVALRIPVTLVTGAVQSASEEPVCGDGLIRGDEACDDSNTQKHDGCSNDCKVEKRYLCAGEPSDCYRD